MTERLRSCFTCFFATRIGITEVMRNMIIYRAPAMLGHSAQGSSMKTDVVQKADFTTAQKYANFITKNTYLYLKNGSWLCKTARKSCQN